MGMYKWLERPQPSSPYALKNPGPRSIGECFEAMDEVLALTSAAQGAAEFDHSRMMFDRIALSVRRNLNHELVQVRTDVQKAANTLKSATWVLVAVAFLIGLVEVYKSLAH